MKLTTNDGLQLFYNQWDTPNPKAVIALIHGLGEHTMRYAHWADLFNKNGYAVVGLDIRGHGQSEGKRGFIPNYDALLDDIGLFLEQVETLYPNTKVVLYGHSLGGAQVLNFLVKRTHHLAAVVATGPFITLSFKPNPIIYAIGKLSRKFVPGLTQSNQLVVENISRDKNVVEAYKKDPLVHDRLSSALGIGAIEAGEFLHHYKGEIEVPTLLLHGGSDQLTNPEGTIAFYNNTKGNRTLKIFPTLFHEIHNEPEKKEVFDFILNWLNAL